MPIDPTNPTAVASNFAGVAARLADIERSIRALKSGKGQQAPNSIQSAQIGPGTITATHITANSIYAGAIQAGAVTASTIAANAVTANAISANSIYTAALQAASVTAAKISVGTITATQIAAGTITATEIMAGTITGAQIAAGTITASNIAAHTITATQIAVGTLTAIEIAAGTITGGLIAAATITATNIASGTITGSLIAATTITGANIVANTITASKLNVSQLSAVSADLGSITAGTITGGLLQTAATGARTALGTGIVTSEGTYNGLVGVDATGAVTFLVNASTGAADFKGTIRSGSTGLGNIAGQIDGGTAIVINTVTGDRLIADTINTRELAASSVTATEIAANTITAGNIAAGAITTTTLAAGAVTTTILSSTAIDGMIVTGATVRTAASGARVLMDSGGLKQYDASSTLLTHLKTDGTDNIFTGNIQARGIVFPETASLSNVSSVRWLLSSTGAEYGAIGALGGSGVGILVVKGVGSDSFAAGGADLQALNTYAGTNNGMVSVRGDSIKAYCWPSASSPGTSGYSTTLLTSDDKSNYVRFSGAATQLKVQTGVTTISVTATAGAQAVLLTLPTAWSTSHTSFLCTIEAVTTNTGVSFIGAATSSLSQGRIVLINSSSTQNIKFTWISFGY